MAIKQSKALHSAISIITLLPLAHPTLEKFYCKQQESCLCPVSWIYLASDWQHNQNKALHVKVWRFSFRCYLPYKLYFNTKGKEEDSQKTSKFVFHKHVRNFKRSSESFQLCNIWSHEHPTNLSYNFYSFTLKLFIWDLQHSTNTL